MTGAEITADWAFDRYEEIRADLPVAQFSNRAKHAAHLSDIAGHFDAFILDAFGVLNRGETAIQGAVERMAALRAAGKRLIVLTNAASYPRAEAVRKYARLGFDFTAEEVVSSRDVAFAHIRRMRGITTWAAIAQAGDDFADAPVPLQDLQADDTLLTRADGFVFLSSAGWDAQRNARLSSALEKKPRPVIVANPDLVAPREEGLTQEPGCYARDLSGAVYFGKPHANALDMALARLPGIARDRIAMVGDTLHTDILGGAAAGVKTVLITDHGLFRGRDVAPYIARSGIVPDWVIPTT